MAYSLSHEIPYTSPLSDSENMQRKLIGYLNVFISIFHGNGPGGNIKFS